MDIARLGLQIESTSAKDAARDLDTFTRAGGKAEGAADAVGRTSRRTAPQVRATGDAATRASRGFDVLEQEAQQAATAMVRAGAAGQTGAAGMSRYGAQVQNAGYQVGDFFVQVASGTSATRALAQQLPQLLGGFGVAGVLIGAAVAAGGALIPMLSGVGDESEDAGEALERFGGALSALDGYTSTAMRSVGDLRAEFGEFADEIQAFNRYLAEVQVAEAVDAFAGLDLTAGIREAVDAYDIMAAASRQFVEAQEQVAAGAPGATSEFLLQAQEAFDATIDGAYDAAAAIGLTYDQVNALDAALSGIDSEASLEDVRDNASAALDVITGMFPEASKLPAALRPAVEQLEAIVAGAARGVVSMEEIASGADAVAVALADADGWAASTLATLDGQASVMQAVLTYGADSAEAAQARAHAEREAFGELLMSKDISYALRGELLAAYDAANGIASVDMAGNITFAADEAGRLAANLAATDAIRAGSVGPDAVIAEQRSAPGAGGQLTGVVGTYSTGPSTRPSSRGGGGRRRSGGGGGRSGVSEAQREQNRLMEEGKRLTESLRTEAEQYAAAQEDVNRLLKAGAIDQETFNRAMAALEIEFDAANMDALRDAIGGIGDAFADAIVKGEDFGDAFGNILAQMASDLISSGINELLAGLLGGAGGGGIFEKLLGGLFGGARANGGPVQAGKAYLVGERGPELFAPGSSGSIMSNERMAQASAQRGAVEIVVRNEPGTVVEIARQEAASVTREGIEANNGRFGDRVQQHRRRPNRRGV